ncbi:hypothetical protein LLEC1_00913 [Akanthomyces lecanii]|uniref:Uncharacterized protein n=1 Tax=Cordyceps confragosa TaxID=2714763 RepID=A0A179ILT4_CORDF|nr:hypothetical protein LLEC1_00913 [Akanthomyces lecanii]
MKIDEHSASPNRAAIEAAEHVYHTVQKAFPEAVANFESKWAAFQIVCHSLPTSAWYSSLLLSIVRANSGSCGDCTRTDEFDTLKRQGPKILPFLVFKLTTDVEKNSYGVFLFNALVKDPDYRGIPDDDLLSRESLQSYAMQIVELSFLRNKVYEELVTAWKEHCAEFKLLLSRAVCCAGDEYWDLLEVGPAFIPHLMVEGGYWYELIHEIVHGRTTNAYAIFERDKWFDVWREFLNGVEYEQAPKYIPNEWDIYCDSAGTRTGPQVREYFRQTDM